MAKAKNKCVSIDISGGIFDTGSGPTSPSRRMTAGWKLAAALASSNHALGHVDPREVFNHQDPHKQVARALQWLNGLGKEAKIRGALAVCDVNTRGPCYLTQTGRQLIRWRGQQPLTNSALKKTLSRPSDVGRDARYALSLASQVLDAIEAIACQHEGRPANKGFKHEASDFATARGESWALALKFCLEAAEARLLVVDGNLEAVRASQLPMLRSLIADMEARGGESLVNRMRYVASIVEATEDYARRFRDKHRRIELSLHSMTALYDIGRTNPPAYRDSWQVLLLRGLHLRLEFDDFYRHKRFKAAAEKLNASCCDVMGAIVHALLGGDCIGASEAVKYMCVIAASQCDLGEARNESALRTFLTWCTVAHWCDREVPGIGNIRHRVQLLRIIGKNGIARAELGKIWPTSAHLQRGALTVKGLAGQCYGQEQKLIRDPRDRESMTIGPLTLRQRLWLHVYAVHCHYTWGEARLAQQECIPIIRVLWQVAPKSQRRDVQEHLQNCGIDIPAVTDVVVA